MAATNTIDMQQLTLGTGQQSTLLPSVGVNIAHCNPKFIFYIYISEGSRQNIFIVKLEEIFQILGRGAKIFYVCSQRENNECVIG